MGASNAVVAQEFYARLFDWRLESTPSPHLGIYSVARNSSGVVAGIYAITNDLRSQGVKPHWLAYVATSNVDESARRAVALGAAVARGPVEAQDHGRYALIRDPEGAFIALWQSGTRQGATFRPGSVSGWVWHDRVASEPDAVASFYQRWLGWTRRSVNAGDNLLLSHGSEVIAEVRSAATGAGTLRRAEAGAWVISFAVADCEVAVRRATELGGALVERRASTETLRCRALLRDPEGVLFGVAAPAR
jgi:predicted enzyme related to lactoylglutathione lyase